MIPKSSRLFGQDHSQGSPKAQSLRKGGSDAALFLSERGPQKKRNPAEPFCRLRIIALLKAFKTEQSRPKAFNKEAPPAHQKVREALLF
ncbi:MAG: hypothetical protein ABWY13_01785, partial [Mesorhizobium sp.]